MIHSLYITSDNNLREDLSPEEMSAALKIPGSLLWVDFEDTPADQDEPLLDKVFGFHPLAIDDALAETHVPKLDNWQDYLYIVLQCVNYNSGDQNALHFVELDIFLGNNYIVTHHDLVVPAVHTVMEHVKRDPRLARQGPDRLLYRLIDEAINSYMYVFEKLEDQIDHNEDEVFSHPTQHTLQSIFSLKRDVLHLRRVIIPQREVLNKLARDDYSVIDAESQVYFRDLYDHMVRLHDIVENIRDLVSGTLDTYLSVINNRLNDIMKTLTLLTTLFMPISFIASFFGMNFFQPVFDLSAWTGRLAFIIMIIVTALTPITMYQWMRRRGWFYTDHS